MLPADVNDGSLIALRKVRILLSRVADEEIRSRVKLLTGDVTRILLARTELDSFSNLEKVTSQTEDLFEYMGNVLRRYYGPAQ